MTSRTASKILAAQPMMAHQQGPSKLYLTVGAAVGIVAHLLVICLFNTRIPTPLMDEGSHTNQARRYYQGHWFVWDNRITTPPGLYVVTLAVVYCCYLPVSAVSKLLEWSGIAGLPRIEWTPGPSYVDSFLGGITQLLRLFRTSPFRFHPVGTGLVKYDSETPADPVGDALLTETDSLFMFRFVNAIPFWFWCVVVTAALTNIIHSAPEDKNNATGGVPVDYTAFQIAKFFRVVRVVTIPTYLIYFYLYYTDGLSTALLLTAYYFMLRASKESDPSHLKTPRSYSYGGALLMTASALFGGVSIAVRQVRENQHPLSNQKGLYHLHWISL